MGFEERNDNTRVSKPIIYEPIKRVPYLELVMRKSVESLPQLVPELRSKLLMQEDHAQGKAREYVDKLKKLRKLTGQVLGVGAGLVGLGLIQGTPIGPYVDAALAAHSGYNLAEQADKGTLGFNTETGLNTLGLIPMGIRAIPYISRAGTKTGEYLSKAGTYVRELSPIFIPTKNSFTRGVGRGTEGITDLVNSGVIRGNPRGTEITAHLFAKLWRNNRFHFKDVMKDTGIPNIEQKFFSRNLNKEEFDAIKNAASKYNVGNSLSAYPVSLRTVSTDPLSEYNSYDDYIKAVQQLVSEVESMTGKIKSGEVKVNTKLLEHENGLPTGTPIEERFGPNSDYVGDGHPLTYWYLDGRNPFRRGYDYAGSDWGVRVLNADAQTPFMHDLHLHPSFFYTPKLDSSNVLVFRRLPFGLGLRVPKNWVRNKFKTINSSNALNITDTEWDAAYNIALKNNNVTELQRLRDLHFKAKTSNNKLVLKNGQPLKVSHGTNVDFNRFDSNKWMYGAVGEGNYFGNESSVFKHKPIIKSYYINLENPYIIDDIKREELFEDMITKPLDIMSKGYDGVLVNYGKNHLDDFELVLYNPNNIKSYKAITYDDNGKIIPLSKRDNFNINDVRYMLPLPILGILNK